MADEVINPGISTQDVFKLASELSNDGSQSSQTPQENQQDARIPYDRFKEVNEERKTLAEQNSKLMQMLENFQQMQQPQAPAQVQQPVQQQPVSLFTEDELNSFEQDIVLDPKSTLQRFGQAILERGVDARVQKVEKTFEEKLAQIAGQFQQAQIPGVISQFKQTRFNPATDAAEIAAFDQALQGIEPSLLTNPATLENVRLAAIGYVADQRRSQPAQNPALFTETPGSSMPGGWGGLGGQQQSPAIPKEVLEVARRMGVDPKEAAVMYQAMNTSGVFRN